MIIASALSGGFSAAGLSCAGSRVAAARNVETKIVSRMFALLEKKRLLSHQQNHDVGIRSFNPDYRAWLCFVHGTALPRHGKVRITLGWVAVPEGTRHRSYPFTRHLRARYCSREKPESLRDASPLPNLTSPLLVKGLG